MKKILQYLKWFMETCLSESGTISFGRAASAGIVLYFLVQDAWLFHRTGHLVDNPTLFTQLSVMTAFYVTNKTTGIFTAKNENKQV